jgi:hypothetical protein
MPTRPRINADQKENQGCLATDEGDELQSGDKTRDLLPRIHTDEHGCLKDGKSLLASAIGQGLRPWAKGLQDGCHGHGKMFLFPVP